MAIVGVDAEGRIRMWNDAATVMFGHHETEVIGEPVDLLVPDDLRERHWEGFRRVMAGGERHLEGASVNLPVRLADDSVAAFPARFNHVYDAFGNVVAAVATFGQRRGSEEPWTRVE